ncbi:MAG: hypothetical protein NTV22_19500, partial [bacterium]|nr:hypothetical protein [bacterium]
SNSLTSAGGTLLSGSPWRAINGIALDVGANVITVYGTNALNVPASDSVVIIRLPGAPANVRATDGTFTGKIRVTYTASVNATKYMICRAPGNNPTNFAELSGAITATTYDDTTVAAGQQYYYAVQAGSLYGWSALSASDSGFTLLAINAGEWKYKAGAKLNRKGKMTGKDVVTGKRVNPALQPLFEQGCRIGLAELMAGVVTNWNGPYTLIPNKNKKIWQIKDPAKGQLKVASIMYTVNSKKGDTLTYQLWTNMPPLGTQMIYILPTNLLFSTGTLLNEQGNSAPPVQFRLRPTGTVDKQGWQQLNATVIESE